VLAHRDFGLQLGVFHVRECVLDFNAIGFAVFFEDEVEVVFGVGPGAVAVLARFAASEEKLLAGEAFEDHGFAVNSECSADIGVGVFVDQGDEFRRAPLGVPVAAVPNEFDGAAEKRAREFR
jgi:hypothetical protein